MERLNTETIYKGCTRPAMLFGIPVTAFVLVIGGSFLLLFLFFGLPWTLLSFIVAWVMKLMCKEDDQKFTQMGVNFHTKMINPNAKFWGVPSFQPVQYRQHNKLNKGKK